MFFNVCQFGGVCFVFYYLGVFCCSLSCASFVGVDAFCFVFGWLRVCMGEVFFDVVGCVEDGFYCLWLF